jgi:hypothetical protein
MVSLAERWRGAEHLEAENGVSERRACEVIGIWRSSKRRPSGRIEEAKLIRRVHELTERYRGMATGRSTRSCVLKVSTSVEIVCG